MSDLDELRAFADVMASGSLTTSARRLGSSKSTLSRRLHQLEEQLGQPLMRRQSNRLLPTEAGRVFHDYCLRILALADQGHQALEELREDISGELTLEVHDALGRGWVAKTIETFMQRYPGVRVNLMIRERLPEIISPQTVVIWFGETGDVGLRQETLALLSCGLYAHPDYLAQHGRPGHPRELERYDWVDLLGEAEQGLMLRHPYHGQVDIRSPGSRLRVNRLVLQSDAIARGQGLGVLPNWMAERRNAAHPGQLERSLASWQVSPTPVSLLYPHGHQPRKISALLDFLRSARPAEWQEDVSRQAS
ncbi:LysR family transcriptional regulator [Halomonas halmophila]|uniref:Iron-regulated virulence regulatory protein IrgB n=1 Tax=Halomonas halmophila TaxID=252 RepID=A0A4Y4F0X2_9GAMM|nr:LysR family transcriptional regulator [Halomonas halmophila]GED21484.1 iron-regulated virulence regulatory protein IrgB [Halomonas halmophila]